MVTVKLNTAIDRSREEVFAFVSNSENSPLWISVFIEVKKTSSSQIGMGTTWQGIGKLLGRLPATRVRQGG
jgi:hypothetical protein